MMHHMDAQRMVATATAPEKRQKLCGNFAFLLFCVIANAVAGN